MARPSILDPDQSYTFRSYFELAYETEDVLAEFGYGFERSRLDLPEVAGDLPSLQTLRDQIEATLPLITLSSEMARREILIAPVLLEVARLCRCQLRIEYPLRVSERLKGNLDYLLRSEQHLIVIEAKHEDLTRGFTQLGVELIALAEWVPEPSRLYGAVTIGELWILGRLDRGERRITQDIHSIPLPGDLERLIRILVGILTSDSVGS